MHAPLICRVVRFDDTHYLKLVPDEWKCTGGNNIPNRRFRRFREVHFQLKNLAAASKPTRFYVRMRAKSTVGVLEDAGAAVSPKEGNWARSCR
jgi:hypothetical protein